MSLADPTNTIIYVKSPATGTSDGSSWDNAASLQGALFSATSGDEIWVAAGTYKPGNSRTDSFDLVPGVAIYGGFAGDETMREDRDWAANPTILSGDIGIPDNNSDNSYHVVTADGIPGTPIGDGTILDGFTVIAGHANGSFPNDRGAGLFCDGIGFNSACNPKLVNLKFLENTAVFGAGIFNYGDSSPAIINTLFSNNTGLTGGAMYNYGANQYDASPELTNVTFHGNTATNDGGALYNYGTGGNSSPKLTNVILWGNTATNGPQIYLYDSAPTIRHAILQGGTSSIVYGGNSSYLVNSIEIHNTDPLFVDAPNGDYHLQANSIAIDKGDNNTPGLNSITSDLDSKPRLVDGDGDDTPTVDLGAYEYQVSCPDTSIFFVDQSAVGDNSGDNWSNAQPDLAIGLEDATLCDVDEIWVAAGTYYPGTGRTDSFNLAAGVGVYGGFVGDETERDARDWAANPTVLSGDIGTPDDNSDNSYHVVYAEGAAGTVITATTILDGFTITDGHANGQPEYNQGGGFYCNGFANGSECSPSLKNLVFTDNTASFWGGAVYNRGDSGVSSPSLTNISFFDNTADRGAAVYNYGASGVSSPSLTNVTFSGNSADRGGAMYSYGYNGDSSPSLVNAVLWGDSASIGSEIYNDSATPIISNSLLQGGIGNIFNDGSSNVTDGGNNIDVNPLFVDAPNGDLRLQLGSPAIDAGDNNAPGLTGVSTDLDHNPRLVDGDGDATATVDMGAYENQTIPTCPATTTLFVDHNATGNNSGDDWPNAQPDLALALTDAARCAVEEIWVGAGTYYPGSARTDSFYLTPGAAVYGGFAGDETEREDRDWVANPTILSGDIGTPNDNSDNSYHVVYVNGTTEYPLSDLTILDGFKITAGNANGNSPDNLGGGFYCNGDGIGNSCFPHLKNITFSNNVSSQRGGAMYNVAKNGGSSFPTLFNVVFSNNTSAFGGALYNYGDDGSCTPTLINVAFTDNQAFSGGAVVNSTGNNGHTHPKLTNVTFYNNTASNAGGAMLNDGQTNPQITNSTFINNSATSGGAVYNITPHGSSPRFTNVTFFNNTATNEGGAIVNDGNNNEESRPSFSNSIFWGNNASVGHEISNTDSTIIINSSLLQGGIAAIENDENSSVIEDGNNLDSDPLFVNAPNGDLRLQINSPAIDKGDNYASGLNDITVDLDGKPRVVDGDGDGQAFVDMGAYEYQPPCTSTTTLFVDHTAAGNNSGEDWANAQPNLAIALVDAARCDVDEVWVAGGTYYPGSERTDSFNLMPGVEVYGGFAGDETEREDRDWVANPTILSGDIGAPDDNSDNSYHVVYADGTTGIVISSSTILDGFTITEGYAFASSPHDYGGGFFCNGTGNGNECSPTLTNIIFSDNLAIGGGALHNRGLNNGISSPTLTNIIFSNNQAIEGGGAMDNLGYLYGNSSPSLTNVIFFGNSADFGGAINNFGGSGGSNNLSLTNVTFSNNSANLYGGAILNDSSISNLINVILWENSAIFGDEIYNDDSSLTISNSLLQGGIASIYNYGNSSVIDGGNNLDSNPLFMDAANGNMHLQIGSPAIDTGDNNAPGLNGIDTDLDGNPRFVDGNGDNTATVDMGAYENQAMSTCPSTTTLFVDQSAAGNDSGDDWQNAQPDLAFALTQAATCLVDEVWVATGTYYPGNERTDSFNLAPGVAVYGGFVGNEAMLGERDWITNPTILSGNIGNPNDDSDNSYHIVYADGTSTVITETTILDGFSIIDGEANAVFPDDRGAGFFCNGSGFNSLCSPNLTNIILSSNDAEFGGAMFNNGYNGNSNPILTDVTFIDNRASHGGALYNDGFGGDSNPILTNVTFYHNIGSEGGALYNGGNSGNSSPILTNVIFSNNRSSLGGAIFNDGKDSGNSSPILTNVTFSGNTAVFGGGAIFNTGKNDGSCTPNLINVILWGDDSATGGDEIHNDDTTLTISHSILGGGIAGIVNSGNSSVINNGNILESAPIFMDAPSDNLRLQLGSPAIDAGDDNACPVEDLDGFLRPSGTACDMGAYEFWVLDITAVSPTDASLSWTPSNVDCVYDIFEATTPYFTPATPAYIDVTSAFVVNGRVGDPATNYFFINRATCNGGLTVQSNEVGEFDFAIVPGD